MLALLEEKIMPEELSKLPETLLLGLQAHGHLLRFHLPAGPRIGKGQYGRPVGIHAKRKSIWLHEV